MTNEKPYKGTNQDVQERVKYAIKLLFQKNSNGTTYKRYEVVKELQNKFNRSLQTHRRDVTAAYQDVAKSQDKDEITRSIVILEDDLNKVFNKAVERNNLSVACGVGKTRLQLTKVKLERNRDDYFDNWNQQLENEALKKTNLPSDEIQEDTDTDYIPF